VVLAALVLGAALGLAPVGSTPVSSPEREVPAAVSSGAPAAPLEIGATVPKDVTLTDIYGKTHTLGDFRGKIVFIHFWSIVCPSEKLAEPRSIELQKAYGDKGVVQIAINANQGELRGAGESYAALREHVEKAGVNFLVTVDPGNRISDLLDGQTTPHCFVIDKDGVLRYSGALDDDPRGSKGAATTQYVRDAIEALIAGRPVATPTTKPYG
jgi:thiol-disulfide isomerase/thioredoxin